MPHRAARRFAASLQHQSHSPAGGAAIHALAAATRSAHVNGGPPAAGLASGSYTSRLRRSSIHTATAVMSSEIESATQSEFWAHTKILFGKNLKLKRQQYLTPARIFCVPVPLAVTMEFVLPLAIIVLLTYVKTLNDLIVFPQGWGGDVPQGQTDAAAQCVPGIDYHWERAVAADEDRTTSCRPYVEVMKKPEAFWRNLAELHALPDVKLALAADDPADVPKVQRMRNWITENWYPRLPMADVPCFQGELIAGDIGWDNSALRDAWVTNNCTHHGVNPGTMSSFADVTHVVGGGTSAELQDYMEGPDYMISGPRVWAALQFHRISGLGLPGEPDSQWEYSVRVNFTHADTTSTIMGPTRVHMWSDTYYADQYILDGFMSLQLLVDRYIIGRRASQVDSAVLLAHSDFGHFEVDARYDIDLIESLSPEAIDIIAEPMRYEPQIVQFLPMPIEGWRKSDFYKVVKNVFALVYLLLFMYSVFGVIATLVEEKETRVRELLRMMSVQNPALIVSWYLTYGWIFGILNVLIVCFSAMGNGLGLFAYSSMPLLFIFFFLFAVSSISYAYMVHTFFDQAKTGGVVGMLMFFSSYFCYTAFRSDETPVAIKQAISWLSPCSFAYGIDQLVKREEIEQGVQFHNWREPLEGSWSGVSFLDVCYQLFVDSLLYSLLGVYLEQVLPKAYGVRRSPWFPLQWLAGTLDFRGAAKIGVGDDTISSTEPEGSVNSAAAKDRAADPELFEAVALPNVRELEASRRCVRINNLRKTFSTPDGEKIAVKGLTLSMYEGQIFVLLGHNGAGKTTTINMLTGLYQPTSGDATVFGKSVTSEMTEVRKLISVCPQHDVLFLSLSVYENLDFFGALRGIPSDGWGKRKRHQCVLEKIAQVGLTEKVHVVAGSLSGGMKRKLSLAIALIGESKAVFLDEPTSGMDPYSRRSTWNTLQSEKTKRVMILTTHFMEEADLLGDRIGVMAEGELRCCGSALFLKRRFGDGYTLTITRRPNCVLQTLREAVTGCVPSANLTSAVGTEVMFQLPLDDVGEFPTLLDVLDSQKDLGVESFGVSITSMEEVFCKIAADDHQANSDAMLHDVTATKNGEMGSTGASVNHPNSSTHIKLGELIDQTASEVFTRHFNAMFLKRLQYGKRDRIALCCTTVLPVLMLFLGLVLLKYGESGNVFANQELRPMDLSPLAFMDGLSEASSSDFIIKNPAHMSTTEEDHSPVPFMASSDAMGTNPEISIEVKARMETVPGVVPRCVTSSTDVDDPYDASKADGQQLLYGVQYENGIPTCGYSHHGRSDQPFEDPRHTLQKLITGVVDPNMILGFAQAVLAAGGGSDDDEPNDAHKISYGALLFHDDIEEDLQRLDICHVPSTLASTIQTGVLHGVAAGGASCSVTLQAPRGQSIKLKVLQNSLRVNSVLIYNSTVVSPQTLFAEVSINHTGTAFRVPNGVVTIVENQLQQDSQGEEWSLWWSFADGCADFSDQCPRVIEQIADFGYNCDTTLDQVSIDDIPWPPVDAETGEEITLPRNPATGEPVTEIEFRQLAQLYLPNLQRQYAGRTLAEFCPVSCTVETCTERGACQTQTRCTLDGGESCYYKQAAISSPHFDCSADGLMPIADSCQSNYLGSGFCNSRCFGELEAWRAHCPDQSQQAVALNDIYARSFFAWGALSAAVNLVPGCDITPFELSSIPNASVLKPLGLTVMYNGSSRHAAPTYMNLASNVLKKGNLYDGPRMTDSRFGANRHETVDTGYIRTNNLPLPFTHTQNTLLDGIKALQAVLFIMIAFAFVPGGIVVFVVREKEDHHNSKHQQMISGASILSFWLSSLAFDVGTYCIALVLSVGAIRWVNLASLVDDGALFASFIILLGYGCAITSCTYMLSFLFDKHTKAQIAVVLLNVFLGLVLMIVQFILAQIEDTQEINDMLMPFYRLSPGFCLGHGLWTLTTINLMSTYMGGLDTPSPLTIAADDCYYLYTEAVVYLLITIAIEYAKSRPKLASRLAPASLARVADEPYDIDQDVAAEAQRIERTSNGDNPDELIRLVKLRKVYRGARFSSAPKVAVKSMSFGVNVGECFGYLGINGAGKTTTMKILTGQILATSGEAYLGGLDITEEQQRVRRLIGYCPQFDALLDKLTTVEHLELFGRLKGLVDKPLELAVLEVLDMLGLQPFAGKLAGTLSGGNKRKLSVGIALIGRPKIIFLDEPSTGVDPVARRFMWGVISRITTDAQYPCCVVLTSHVMEEVEALCTKVGVVVGGRLRCLGSNQHLKSRFGCGYVLELKLKRPSADAIESFCAGRIATYAERGIPQAEVAAVCQTCGDTGRAGLITKDNESGWVIHDACARDGAVSAQVFAQWWLGEDAVQKLDSFVLRACPATRLERQNRTLSYSVGDGATAREIFAAAEAASVQCGVDEYGVEQCSLEQIFNSFAAQQDEERGGTRGMVAANAVNSSNSGNMTGVADGDPRDYDGSRGNVLPPYGTDAALTVDENPLSSAAAPDSHQYDIDNNDYAFELDQEYRTAGFSEEQEDDDPGDQEV